MNDWTAALNHLIGAWIAAGASGAGGDPGTAPPGAAPPGTATLGGWTLAELRLEPDGFRLVARPGRREAAGELVLRGRVEAEHGGRQKLHLSCERAPEHLPELLAALRPLLETARLALELDFRGAPARA